MGRKKLLSDTDIEYLRTHVDTPVTDLARTFNVSVATIYKYYKNLGIRFSRKEVATNGNVYEL